MFGNEKILVEALKNFMNQSVIPSLPQNHPSLNEWKFLNGIISSNPIDCSQLEFYLHMVNKNNSPQQQSIPNKSISSPYSENMTSPPKSSYGNG